MGTPPQTRRYVGDTVNNYLVKSHRFVTVETSSVTRRAIKAGLPTAGSLGAIHGSSLLMPQSHCAESVPERARM